MRTIVPRSAGTAVVLSLIGLGAAASTAAGMPPYLDAFIAKYPTSTLPQRMQTLTGSACYVCHSPTGFSVEATCYRLALRERLWLAETIEQALDHVHYLDPDGDGVPSGVEILMQRADDPSHIGYHPGLVGPTGTDPCAPNPSAPVTNQSETPALACYANCDGSTIEPILNVDDFTCFINEFAAAQGLSHEQQVAHYANCDGSTIAPVLNVDDFTCFINAFAQGCP